MSDQSQAHCPATGCDGAIKIPDSLPSGVYPCICRGVEVRLSWATTAAGRRVPVLQVADQPDQGSAS